MTAIEERLWSKVSRGLPDECWEFQGHRDAKGYGRICSEGKTRKAHRVAHGLINGPIPDGMIVLHRCDNPPCCNPAHLSVGTVLDNNRDMFAKGRGNPQPHAGAAFHRARTHCPQGHPFDEANTYYHPNGARVCRICRRGHSRQYRARRR